MRHDAHYVDTLAASAATPVGRMVPIDKVDPNPDQPRQAMGDLSDLVSSLTEKGIIEPLIVRQRGEYKRAVQSIEGGLVQDGWKQLETMGAIVEASGAERIERLAADYLHALKAGDSVLVVAPTNRERLAVTEAWAIW